MHLNHSSSWQGLDVIEGAFAIIDQSSLLSALTQQVHHDTHTSASSDSPHPATGCGADIMPSPFVQGEVIGQYRCVLHHHCVSPQIELQRFKRIVSCAATFANLLHEKVGVPIRGVQGKQQHETRRMLNEDTHGDEAWLKRGTGKIPH